MSEFKIMLREDQMAFLPGEELVGAAYWKLNSAPTKVDIKLLWYTRGKGTEDVEVIETVTFESPQAEEARQFRFKLPLSPYSFSGKLISLIWAIELVAAPTKEAHKIEILMGPEKREVLLGAVQK